MKPICILLWHHWRRTRLWLLLPLLMSAAWTLTMSIEISRAKAESLAWGLFQTSIIGNVYILAVGALGLVMALGSGESNAAIPAYAQTLPIKDRRWSMSYILYSLLAFGVLAAAITVVDWQVWQRNIVEPQRQAQAQRDAARAAAEAAHLTSTTPQPAPPPVVNPFMKAKNTPAPASAEDALRRSRERQTATTPRSSIAVEKLAFKGAPTAATAEEAIKAWRSRLRDHPEGPRLGTRGPALARRSQSPDESKRWKEPLGFLGIVFFCQSVFLALTLIPRVTIRIFAQALALATVPTAAIALTIFWRYDERAVVLWVLMFAAGVALVHGTVAITRHGRKMALRRITEALGWTPIEPYRRFAKTRQALAWYDWMTFARYLLYGTAGLGVVMSLYAISEGINRPMVSGFAVVPAAGLAGLYLAYRLYHGDRQDNDAYLATLPITVEQISHRRLATIGKAVLTAWLVGLGVEAFVTTAHFTLVWHPRTEWYAWPEISSLVFIAPVAAWVMVWLTGPLFYPAVGLWILWATFYAVHAEEIATYIGLIILAVLLIAAAVWLVRLAKRRELLAGWNKCGAVLAPLLSAAIVMPVLLYARDLDAPDELAYVVGLVMCLLAAVPFIALPLAIDRYRHR